MKLFPEKASGYFPNTHSEHPVFAIVEIQFSAYTPGSNAYLQQLGRKASKQEESTSQTNSPLPVLCFHQDLTHINNYRLGKP